MVRRVHREEQGLALITAILLSAVVLIMALVVVQLSLHALGTSAYDRRRVQSIAAAEAGIDRYLSLLTVTGGTPPPCSLTGSLPELSAQFTVTASFFAVAGASVPMPCPSPPEITPQAVRLVSTGSSTGSLERTMEAYVELSVSQGATFGVSGALFAENGISFTSTAQIGGSLYNDADIYSNGTVTVASGSAIYGNVQAQGGVTLKSNAEVKRDVWAGGSVILSSGSRVLGNATTPGSMTLANNALIQGDAKAGGTITGGTVQGYRSPNTAGVTGPSPRSYPTFTFNATDWIGAGYAMTTFAGPGACSSAESYIRSTWTGGKLLVRILEPGSTCTLQFNSGTYNVRDDLAIISDGPVYLRTNARFAPSPADSEFEVFLIAGLSGSVPCNIRADSNSGFGPGLTTFVYVPAPCTIDMFSNSVISRGQFVGGTLSFKHTATFAYTPLLIPGSGVGGFNQDLVYKREIVNQP